MPNGVPMNAGSSSRTSPVGSPQNNTSRISKTHSRKRSWPHDDEERIRAARRSRQQGPVPRNGVAVAQNSPATMFQTPQYFLPGQQTLAWSTQLETQFNVALDPASAHIVAQGQGVGLSAQGFATYQPQHHQPTYAGFIFGQPQWDATAAQELPRSGPPPNVVVGNFGQFGDMNALAGADFIYSQHDANHPLGNDSLAQHSVPPTQTIFNQTFNFNQSRITHQSTQSTLPTPTPFASTTLSVSETLLEPDEKCNCGPNCSCVGCGTHFDNAPTRTLVEDLNSILIKDDEVGQHEGHSYNYNQISTSPQGICPESSTITETTPGNLPSPAVSISEDRVLGEGVLESELSEFAGRNEPKEHTRLLPDYMTVQYSLDTASVATPETTDLNPHAEFGIFGESWAQDFPGVSGEYLGGNNTNPISDFFEPMRHGVNTSDLNQGNEYTNPIREVIDLSADEDDPVSPNGPSACCMK
ncbi:hypothetical protein MMC26_000769 [Xylographa opegraphella]|nr:hypothetical protein [Xylographa opegraphella]